LASAAALVLAIAGSLRAQPGATLPAQPEPVRQAIASLIPEQPPGVRQAVAASDIAPGVVQAGCSSCSGGLFGPQVSDLGPAGGCADEGCCGYCYPGRKPCDCCCDGTSGFGKFFCGFYQCVCCPDPCYEPHWVAAADSAFFTDAARPMTQMRIRYFDDINFFFPNRAEFFMAGPPKGPAPGSQISYQAGYLYNEVAVDRFSTSIEVPYEYVAPQGGFNGASGVGDLIIGTKSMLLDCELMQFTFGMKVFVPTGNFNKGIGTGHTALEPELIAACKLAPRTYLQAELAYRFPLGGDTGFEGPVLHWHLALNHVLWCCGHDIQLIGTLELNGYEFTGGQFSPATGDTNVLGFSNGVPFGSAKDIGSIASIGPGIRLVFCDRIDFGVGSAFNLTGSDNSIGNEIIAAEFRWRF
jgi:hypothetical protein